MSRPSSQMALLIDAVTDYAIFMLSPEGLVRTWNRGAERLKQWKANEIIGQHFSTFYPTGFPRARLDEELQIARDVGRFEDEGWRVRKDGSRFWANVVITPVLERGKLIGFAKVTRDLSERQAATDALRESEERLRLMIGSVQDYAIYMLAPDGTIITWNPGAQRLKGYTASEIIGQHFSVFYEEDGKWQRELRMARENGRYEEEGWRVRKDGTRFWASIVISAMRDEKGELRGFAKVTRDLTSRLEAQETKERLLKADEAVKLRDEFLSVAAHELRTPLTPLSMYLQSMSRATQAQEPGSGNASMLEKAQRQVKRLSRLIDGLLDFSRIHEGRLELNLTRMDVVRTAHTVVEDLKATAISHQLVISGPPELLVRADEHRIEQVILNLLQNAIKYSPAGGRIDVIIERTDNNEAKVSVIDRGIGVPLEDQSQLFHRFFRARNATTRHFGGVGLGLYLSSEIVRRHGGRFEVTSAADQGSTFSFFMPLSLQSEVRLPVMGKGHVLLVDDDPDILDALGGLLKADGYSVNTARNGAEALKLFVHQTPDCLLIDLMMPVLDGRGLIQRLHQEHPGLTAPIILFSADQRVAQRATEVRADGALQKPVDYNELQGLMSRLMHRTALPN